MVSSSLLHVDLYFNSFSIVLNQYAMIGYDLQDGTHIPPGSKVVLDLKAIHFNPQIYPDPERCDLFRSSRLREKEGTDIKIRVRVPGFKCKPFYFSPGNHDIPKSHFLSFILVPSILVPVRQIYRDHTSCENNRNHWG